MRKIIQIGIILLCSLPTVDPAQNNFKKMDKLARSYFERQSLDSALLYAEKSLLLAEKESGKNNPNYYNTLTLLSDITFYIGDNEKGLLYTNEEKDIRKKIQGEKNSDFANCLNNLGSIYENIAEYDSAYKYYTSAAKIRKEVIGKNSAEYANSLSSIGVLYTKTGDYLNAEKFLSASLKINIGTLGNKSLEVASCYNQMAQIYQLTGKYKAADSLFNLSLNLQKELNGENNGEYSSILNNLGALHREMADYSTAISFYNEALKIIQNIYGVEHIEYALTLNNLMEIYHDLGDFSSSEMAGKKAIKIIEKTLGKKHPYYSIVVSNLSSLYTDMGNLAETEKMTKEIVLINKELLGENHPDYLTYLNNLAFIYRFQGNLNLAEEIFKKVLIKRKEILGEKHPLYALSLNNLSELYIGMGNYELAEIQIKECLKIRNEVLGNKHPSYADAINNLALIYKNTGKYSEAETLLTEQLNIFKETYGTDHYNYAEALSNIAVINGKMKNYKLMEDRLLEALDIYKNKTDKKNKIYALCLNNIGSYYKLSGQLDKAENYYKQSLLVISDLIGEKNDEYNATLVRLADNYNRKNNLDSAKLYYHKMINSTNELTEFNFSGLSEKEKEMYFKNKSNNYNSYYSFIKKHKNKQPELVGEMYNITVRNKGLLLRSSTAMRTSILNKHDSSLTNKYNKWLNLKKNIAKTYSTEKSLRKSDPLVLEQEANEIEKQLVKESQTFGSFKSSQQITWQTVQKELNKDEAAVEFIHFNEGFNEDSITYCALIIRPGYETPKMIELFEEQQLLTLMNQHLNNDVNSINSFYDSDTKAGKSLYGLIWEPLIKELKSSKTIYISSTGLLHKLSLSAIGKKHKKYISETYNVILVSNTGHLTNPKNKKFEDYTSAEIYGGVNYEIGQNPINDKGWRYLEGTKKESELIFETLKNNNITAQYYSGNEASEEQFKKSTTLKEIIHISTHGFFFPDPEQQNDELKKTAQIENKSNVTFRGASQGVGVWTFVKNKNPLMRSGLVFAHANQVWDINYKNQYDDDGVLTAAEVATMDLRNTKLVVLSACETGLGDIKGSEGVYGLQRAFKMAGVKYIIMSLWQVPDKETSEFMITFYTKLTKCKDIKKAFNDTQKEMRKKYDPYFWAAFVLVE